MENRLLHAVMIKTMIEIVLVCVVATTAAFSNFSPLLRGAIDIANRGEVAGWAYDPMTPDQSIEVQLFIDDRFIISSVADRKRQDLVSAGAAKSPDHGFSFEINEVVLSPGRHHFQVFAVRCSAGASKILSPLAETPLPVDIPR